MQNIDKLLKKVETYTAEQIIEWAINEFSGDLCFSTSLSFEDQAITHLICQKSKSVFIFTLDTGRLFQETYDTIVKTEKFYGIKIHTFFPDYSDVEKMVFEHGHNLFYESIEKRQMCCRIRKIEPLKRALKGKKAWITGLRREQSITRATAQKIEYDEKFDIIKINPLLEWTEKQAIDFVLQNNIPFNKLQMEGYRSIGCLPCTRPIGPEDDIRAGRWWWENPEHKECGLHKR